MNDPLEAVGRRGCVGPGPAVVRSVGVAGEDTHSATKLMESAMQVFKVSVSVDSLVHAEFGDSGSDDTG